MQVEQRQHSLEERRRSSVRMSLRLMAPARWTAKHLHHLYHHHHHHDHHLVVSEMVKSVPEVHKSHPDLSSLPFPALYEEPESDFFEYSPINSPLTPAPHKVSHLADGFATLIRHRRGSMPNTKANHSKGMARARFALKTHVLEIDLSLQTLELIFRCLLCGLHCAHKIYVEWHSINIHKQRSAKRLAALEM